VAERGRLFGVSPEEEQLASARLPRPEPQPASRAA
jgi:hypothetical protein